MDAPKYRQGLLRARPQALERAVQQAIFQKRQEKTWQKRQDYSMPSLRLPGCLPGLADAPSCAG